MKDRVTLTACYHQMVTVEVEIKEGDKEPDQQLDEGEHIERVTVPLDQLYDKLKGTFPSVQYFLCEVLSPGHTALSKEEGKIVDAR